MWGDDLDSFFGKTHPGGENHTPFGVNQLIALACAQVQDIMAGVIAAWHSLVLCFCARIPMVLSGAGEQAINTGYLCGNDLGRAELKRDASLDTIGGPGM